MAMMRAPLYGHVIPLQAILWLAPLSAFLKMLLGSLLLWVAWEGMRKDHAGAWLAMPAVGLIAVSLYQQELIVLHLPLSFFPFGICSRYQPDCGHRVAEHHHRIADAALHAIPAAAGAMGS